MIEISRLYCDSPGASDALRYPGPHRAAGANVPAVVVFNCTRRCNLRCVHCYSSSTDAPADDELTTAAARRMIDDLAGMGTSVLLFSGGEPLMRQDIVELIAHANGAALRAVLSTNGVLLTEATAEKLRAAGLAYAGVSLDGIGPVNDSFRGRDGAFSEALTGIRHCRAAGIKVGLRFTMTADNVDQIPAIFDLLVAEQIGRVCFYHLVPAGRGSGISRHALTHEQTREALDLIMDRAASACAARGNLQVLTVDNHADGPYICLRLLREGKAVQAATAQQLLTLNGGNSSGQRLGAVRWDGDVLADQFWADQVLGNVKQRPFSRIWTDPTHPLLGKLRDRKRYLKGRCPQCRWLNLCNGNLRARAAAAGDMWGDDPGCYLTDEEIAP